MATTSIYWSSRLDRSDWLQHSTAIFSCKTRRVAVYLEKRAFPTGILDRWQLFTYLLTHKLFSSILHSTIPSATCLRMSDARLSSFCALAFHNGWKYPNVYCCVNTAPSSRSRQPVTSFQHCRLAWAYSVSLTNIQGGPKKWQAYLSFITLHCTRGITFLAHPV